MKDIYENTFSFAKEKIECNSLDADLNAQFPEKSFNKGQIIGGLLFGFGWAMTGACPGPLFAQLGYGATATVVTIAMAIVGTWVYGLIREKLPH